MKINYYDTHPNTNNNIKFDKLQQIHCELFELFNTAYFFGTGGQVPCIIPCIIMKNWVIHIKLIFGLKTLQKREPLKKRSSPIYLV